MPLPVRGVVSSALPNDRLFRHPVQDGTDRSLLEPTAIRYVPSGAEERAGLIRFAATRLTAFFVSFAVLTLRRG